MSLNKLITRLESEKPKYAVNALEQPESGTSFEFGKHHGVLKGFHLVEQWIQELLEDNDDDGSE